MDIAKLKELIALMAQNDLSEIDIRTGDDFIKLKRGSQPQTIINHQPVMYAGPGAPPAPVAHAPSAPMPPGATPATPAAAPATPGVTIDSPMVGTFYASPNPDAPAFVKVGQSVSPDTVVCIIEAMKVFNEIKAEKAGVIESVLVKNGQSVEFGQKLFSIRPA